jgi:hypothetical protein
MHQSEMRAMKLLTVNFEFSGKGSPAMCKILCSTVLTLLIGLVQFAGAAAVATIGFSPGGSISVTSGGQYSWDLYVTILPQSSTEIVSAYSLDVKYDPSILKLSLSPVTFSSNLGNFSMLEVYQGYRTGTGLVNIAAVSLLSDSELQTLQGTGSTSRSITLATLLFDATVSGSTSLSVSLNSTSGLRDIKGTNNIVMDIVPEPSSYLLAVIALTAVVLAARRQRSNAS